MFLKYIQKGQVFSTKLNIPVRPYICHYELAAEEVIKQSQFHIIYTKSSKFVDFPGNRALSVKKLEFFRYSYKCNSFNFKKQQSLSFDFQNIAILEMFPDM